MSFSLAKDPALEYDFGLTFNYAQWTMGTEVTLCNVTWNNDYRDIVQYPSRAALNTYLDRDQTANLNIRDMSQVKTDQPIRVSNPLNQINEYNYIRVSNPLQPVAGDKAKFYYYFITAVRPIAPNTTEIQIQLDVWQTFGHLATYGNCYIERGHIGIANTRNFDNYGRDYLTIPEGIDYGGEYRVISKRSKQVMSIWGDKCDILVASTVDLKKDAGTVDAPILNSATGGRFNGLIAGADYYVFGSMDSFTAYMGFMADKPWVTQGIISITMIPKLSRYALDVTYQADGIPNSAPPMPPKTLTHGLFPNWRDHPEITENIPARYRHLKKFWTFPYMTVELTTWGGSPVMLKPESWANDNGNIIERAALVPPNQRIVFAPQKYNANKTSVIDKVMLDITEAFPGAPLVEYGDGDDNGEYLDITTQISSFPTMALVNNGAINYMASNQSSINYQHRSADWSQNRTQAGIGTSYDQASAGMELSNELTGLGRTADSAQTALNNQTATSQAVVGAVSSVAGGIGGGAAGITAGLAGAATAGVNLAITTNQNNQSLGIRSAQANNSNKASVDNAGYVRDTNASLAKFSSRGDYAVAVAGINAKVQDAQLIQPTTSGQVGGEAFNLIHGTVEVSMRIRLIDHAAIRTLGEYWLRYGYPVRQFGRMPADFKAMSKFTYWKLTETNLRGRMSEVHKQALRGLFEKGVTVWSNADDIGMIDIADNVPVAGLTL